MDIKIKANHDTVKHWTITTGLERRFTGTRAQAEQLQAEEREYYDSLTDGGEVCAYVVGSSLECHGVPTDDEDEQYKQFMLATGGI
jgi:hypothetical protein